MKRTHPRWTLLLLALLLLFPMGCRKEEEEKPPLTQEEKETRQVRVTEAMAQVDLDQDLVRLEPYADDGKGLHLNSREMTEEQFALVRSYVEGLTYAAPSLDDWVGKDVDRAMKGPEAYVEIDTPWHFIEIATWGPDCARVWVWNRIGSHGVSQNWETYWTAQPDAYYALLDLMELEAIY